MAKRVHILSVSLRDGQLVLHHQLQVGEKTPSTGRSYQKPFDETRARELADEVICSLRRHAVVSSDGRIAWEELQTVGRDLYDTVFPAEIGKVLQEETANVYLILNLVRELVWIPWELTYDGKEFLSQHFRVARRVQPTPAAEKSFAERVERKRTGSGALIALGDTEGLHHVREHEEVKKQLKRVYPSAVSSFGRLSMKELQRHLKRDYQILHFVGHGEYAAHEPEKTGWRCADGKLLSCQDIVQSSSQDTFPYLIFANACQSAQATPFSAEEYVSDVCLAFLEKGVPHYIGTIERIPDEPARRFSRTFYRELASGSTIGAALSEARREFFKRPGLPIWAYYVYYGDPLETVARVADKPAPPPPPKRCWPWAVGAGVCLALLGILLILLKQGYLTRFPSDTYGIAILDFSVLNEGSSKHEAVRYIEADGVRQHLKSLRFSHGLAVRNVPRAFVDAGDAVRYGRRIGARIVVWGYGKRGSKAVNLQVVISRVPFDLGEGEDAQKEPSPFEIGFGGTDLRLKPYEVDVGTLREIDGVVQDITSDLPYFAILDSLVSTPTETGLSAAKDLALSCLESREVKPQGKTSCALALASAYMTEGRTQPAEKLILQHISKNVSADEGLFLRATFTLSKVENLGLPANLYLILALFQFEKTIPAAVLPALQVSLKLCIANGELHQAKFLAEALLQGIAMSTTAPPPYPALGLTEFDTLANLARIHNALGEYDAALRTLEQMDHHPFNVAEIAREIRFATYFAKFRETGAPDWEAKATSTASTALEHAALRTSKGQGSLLLAELRKQAKDDRTRFRLAVALLNEGLRTGDRTKMEEAISICRAPLPATRFETVRYRRCALVAAEAEFFLGREKESLKSYMAVWPLDKLELGAVDRAEVLLLLGNLALRRFRDFRAARDYFREAMELVSGEKAVWGEGFDVTTMAALGYAAVRSGDTAEGLAEFHKGYRHTVKESRVDAAVSLAWAFLEAGNLTAARSVLSQREFRDNPRIHVALGLLSHRQGKPREAIDQYLRALGVKGGRPDETTSLYLAMAYLENGEPAKALEHLSRLSGLATPGTCPAAMRKRYIEPGWAWEPRLCEDRVFLEKHITELERRLSENPASVELRDELFVLYRIRLAPRGGSGSDSKARAQLADAIRLDRRDALNAPEITLAPGRRFIDAAVLDLEVGDPRKALQDLRELLAWYVGSPKADLWAFEVTRKFDVFAGRRNKEVPAWYVPSLTWPESLKP